MQKRFEDVIKYNVYEAIEIKSEEKNNAVTEWMYSSENNPARIPNNPVFLDYDWVYDHVEEIFIRDIFYYQKYQNMEAYYTFFKAVTNKYKIEDDYNEYLRTGKISLSKWWLFVVKLIDFISHSFDNRVEELLKKDDVINYFLRYPLLYDCEMLERLSGVGVTTLLEKTEIARYYIDDCNRLIHLIREYSKVQIPISLMENKKIIRDIARTPKLEEFYFDMYFILEQCSGYSYFLEHKKFCDEETSNIKDGILPCYQEEYDQSPNMINKEDILKRPYYKYSMQNQVFERIFQRFNIEELPKNVLYKEYSKYVVIGMFISSHFETDPYNLMVDIETLYEFSRQNNRELRGNYIYDVLINFEDKTLEEIIMFYQRFQNVPLKEMLYDDWKEQEELFALELNSNILNPLTLPCVREDGITYYDISDVDKLLLVHETSISIDNEEGIEKMLGRIKTGCKGRICLSVQDQEHNSYYSEIGKKRERTVKFLYGPLVPNRVGIVYHEDAYSICANGVEGDFAILEYKRRLYTIKSLLEETYNYNEINYVIDGNPFLPIGIICEDGIEEIEIDIAKILNIPLLYRKMKEITNVQYKKEKVKKHYQNQAYKSLF